jgi:hypothetical protein
MKTPEIQTTPVHQTVGAIGRSSNRNRSLNMRVIIIAAALVFSPFSRQAFAALQDNWRYCEKCHVMFFDGYADKGRCAAGGGHSAQGFMFKLEYDIPETPHAQAHWRYCDKCHAMFFNGYPMAGVCPAGGAHHAQGYKFVLWHDSRPPWTAQPSWRYCDKCHGMFYNGYSDKGHCPAGEGHRAQGFNFVLRYEQNLDEGN